MKMKRLMLGLGLGAIILSSSCDDDLSKVGTSIQDGDDKISVSVDSFRIEASTVLMDAVYAKSDTGLLGELYDPLYGNLKSDYLCQFYSPDNFRFSHTPINETIDSVDFRIFYSSWVGDSLAPMRVQIFPVDKQLERNFYTNLNPEDYADMNTVLGSQSYTAYDRSVPDSIRNADGYYPSVTVRMPKELGQRFYDQTINNPASFNDQESFNEFFPGLYVTNTFGSGSIIKVDLSYLTIYYKYIGKGSQDQDTIIRASETFNVTKEVIQLNRFKNANLEELIAPNEKYTYLKTPAGVATQLVIPAKEIAPFIDGRILNNMPLTLYALPQEEYEYALIPPTSLLLLPVDSVETFFENNKVEDGQTSFVATNASRTYSFGNISNVLKTHIDKSPGEDLTLVVIPINRKVATDSYYGSSYTSAITHYLYPSGLKLRKDDQVTKIGVTSSKYGERITGN